MAGKPTLKEYKRAHGILLNTVARQEAWRAGILRALSRDGMDAKTRAKQPQAFREGYTVGAIAKANIRRAAARK